MHVFFRPNHFLKFTTFEEDEAAEQVVDREDLFVWSIARSSVVDFSSLGRHNASSWSNIRSMYSAVSPVYSSKIHNSLIYGEQIWPLFSATDVVFMVSHHSFLVGSRISHIRALRTTSSVSLFDELKTHASNRELSVQLQGGASQHPTQLLNNMDKNHRFASLCVCCSLNVVATKWEVKLCDVVLPRARYLSLRRELFIIFSRTATALAHVLFGVLCCECEFRVLTWLKVNWKRNEATNVLQTKLTDLVLIINYLCGWVSASITPSTHAHSNTHEPSF